MNKKDWQKQHGFSDEAMASLDLALKVFGTPKKPAKITRIWDVRELGRWGDEQRKVVLK